MDNITLIHVWQLLRVVAYAVFATYLTHLATSRGRDRMLYGTLALQFGFGVVWVGLGVFYAEIESVVRPWQTIPVLLTLAVIVRDFCAARSKKMQALRKLERNLSVEVQATNV